MKVDLNLTFGDIFNNDPQAFLDQLIDIQTHTANRRKAEKWADRLRLIDISKVPNLEDNDGARITTYVGDDSPMMFFGPKKPIVLPLLEKKDDDGDIPYIAVSWRWSTADQPPEWGCDVRESFDYKIKRPGKKAHKSRFPDHFFDRVIIFAQDRGIDRLWIDQECVYQEDDEDRSLGVQIMDAVYEGCKFAVGLSTTPLMHQDELVVLVELLAGYIFQDADDTDTPKYKYSPTMEAQLLKTQTLILRILSDSRWSRAWIFQEDHLASNRMKLLIPHSKGLKTCNNMYDFGFLPGNLTVEVSAFRKAVTKFCMASSEHKQRWPISEMLGKAKQYNIFNKISNNAQRHPRNKRGVRMWTDGAMTGWKMNQNVNYLNMSTYPSTTLSILDDICHRDLERTEDRIAIMANAAKFSKRLDISQSSQLIVSEAYSMSAILLALILLNGEIMDTAMTMSHKELMKYTLRQFLEEVQYHFNAPTLKYEQSFINHCRFKETTITRRGVEAPGFLFKLLPKRKPFSSPNKPHPLKLTDDDRRSIQMFKFENKDAQKFIRCATFGRKFNSLGDHVMMMLTSKLKRHYGEDCKLANFLWKYLIWDTEPDTCPPSTPYVLDMMTGLVQALIDGRELRFARFDGEPDNAEPSAIFLSPYRDNKWFSHGDNDPGTDNNWVFTSWDNGWRSHGMERLASMEVAPFTQGPNLTDPVEALPQWDPEHAETSFLRSYGWINGVWDVEGRHMNKYTFPIAGLTSPQSPGDHAGWTGPPPSGNGDLAMAPSPPTTIRRSKRKRSDLSK
jgi:hypothetical protein